MAQKTTVTGTILNTSKSDTVRLIIDTTYIALNEIRLKKGGESDDQLSFAFEFDLDQNVLAEFLVNKEKISLFIEPGNAIVLSADKDSLKTNIQFEGEGGANNAFLHKFDKEFAGQFDKYAIEDEMKEQFMDIFEMKKYDQLQDHQNYLKDNLDKFEQSKDFQAFVKNHVRYNYLGSMIAYPIVRGNADVSKKEVEPLPKVVVETLKPEWIVNPDAMVSDRYRYFVDNYVVYKTSEVNEFKKFTDYTTSVESKYVYARQHIEGEPFKFFLAKYLQSNYTKVKPSTVRWIYNHLAEEDKSNRYSEKLKTILDAKMLEEDPIEEVVEVEETENHEDVMMTDLEGKPVSFSDFKGKVVYVDFWASWCGPCRSQFPHAAKLKEQLEMELNKKEKEKIVFLYISIDDTDVKWKAAVEKMQIKGFQAHSPGGWNSKVVKQFGISGIPRYMLINKKGEFVEQNAPRPSDPAIMQMLMEMIRE